MTLPPLTPSLLGEDPSFGAGLGGVFVSLGLGLGLCLGALGLGLGVGLGLDLGLMRMLRVGDGSNPILPTALGELKKLI